MADLPDLPEDFPPMYDVKGYDIAPMVKTLIQSYAKVYGDMCAREARAQFSHYPVAWWDGEEGLIRKQTQRIHQAWAGLYELTDKERTE